MEQKAISESEGEYDPGSDLETEANRSRSAREDIDQVLKTLEDES